VCFMCVFWGIRGCAPLCKWGGLASEGARGFHLRTTYGVTD
jgi:hypothetical protein